MTYAREPVLQPVTIESLRPTQITVGMREVEEKRKCLRKRKPQSQPKPGVLSKLIAAQSSSRARGHSDL